MNVQHSKLINSEVKNINFELLNLKVKKNRLYILIAEFIKSNLGLCIQNITIIF